MSDFEVPCTYLASSEQLAEELRYSSRGYMLMTAPMPLVVGIVKDGLEHPSDGSDAGSRVTRHYLDEEDEIIDKLMALY